MSDTTEDVKDLEEIVPSPETAEIAGIPVTIRRLKTLEFLSLLRVLTVGFGPGLSDIKFDLDDEEALARDVIAVLLLSVPDAGEEFVQFLQKIVEPKKRQDAKALNEALENPELDDLLDLIAVVIEQEKDDLRSLAGKAQAMWARLNPKPQGPQTAG